MRTRVALLTLGCCTLLTACPSASAEGCGPAPADGVETLERSMTTPGKLRYATARQGADAWFVTVELHEPDHEEAENGDLLTFSAPSPDARDFVAVDEKAREHSSLPDAPFAVDADGAVESRGCTAVVRDEAAER